MSCFAATKHCERDGSTVSRMKPTEKPKATKHTSKYEEVASAISLDKYNQKLMNAIWGIYNRSVKVECVGLLLKLKIDLFQQFTPQL